MRGQTDERTGGGGQRPQRFVMPKLPSPFTDGGPTRRTPRPLPTYRLHGCACLSAIGSAGGSQPHDNMMPFLVISFIISLYGIWPQQN